MTQFIETLVGIFQSSGFAKFGEPGGPSLKRFFII